VNIAYQHTPPANHGLPPNLHRQLHEQLSKRALDFCKILHTRVEDIAREVGGGLARPPAEPTLHDLAAVNLAMAAAWSALNPPSINRMAEGLRTDWVFEAHT
jgi:hypothetical protein